MIPVILGGALAGLAGGAVYYALTGAFGVAGAITFSIGVTGFILSGLVIGLAASAVLLLFWPGRL